jgi:hypothetical protein
VTPITDRGSKRMFIYSHPPITATMSQLNGTIQFWRVTGGYLCVAKLKNQWYYVGCSLGEYERFLNDCKRWGMLLTSVRQPSQAIRLGHIGAKRPPAPLRRREWQQGCRGLVPEIPQRHVPEDLVQQGGQLQARQRQPLVHDFDLLAVVLLVHGTAVIDPSRLCQGERFVRPLGGVPAGMEVLLRDQPVQMLDVRFLVHPRCVELVRCLKQRADCTRSDHIGWSQTP